MVWPRGYDKGVGGYYMKKVSCLVLTVLIAIGITSCSGKPFEPLVLDELWNVIEYFDFENADEDDWRELLQDAFELLEEAEKELKDAGGNEYSVEWYKDDLEAMGLCQEKYSEAKRNAALSNANFCL